jgi:hypothetical protein
MKHHSAFFVTLTLGALIAVAASATGCEEPEIILLPEVTTQEFADGEEAVSRGEDLLAEIPDPVFRVWCEGQMEEWDSNGDGALSADEAGAVTVINIGHSFGYKGGKVRSLAGLEHFPALTSLYCDGHRLKDLDISQNRALRLLWCIDNPGGRKATFVVRAWFDNDTVPQGTLMTDSWRAGGKVVGLDFRKVD